MINDDHVNLMAPSRMAPVSESEVDDLARETMQWVDELWEAHRQGRPEFSGAQCNFLIEIQRAIRRYAEASKNG